MEDTQPKVHQNTRAEELIIYHNGHIHEIVAAEINLRVLGKLPPKQVLAEKLVQINRDAAPMRQKVLVEDEMKKEQKRYDENRRLLDAIEELQEEERAKENKKDKS